MWSELLLCLERLPSISDGLLRLPASITGFPIFEKQDLCPLQMRYIWPFSFLPALVPNCGLDGNSQLAVRSCLLLVGRRPVIKLLPTKARYGPKVPPSATTQRCDSAPRTRKEEAIQRVSGKTVCLTAAEEQDKLRSMERSLRASHEFPPQVRSSCRSSTFMRNVYIHTVTIKKNKTTVSVAGKNPTKGLQTYLVFSEYFHVKKSFFSLWLNKQHFIQNYRQ